jgi:hypothetical protein
VSDPIALSSSLADIAAQSQRVISDFIARSPDLGSVGDPAGIGRAFLDLTAKIMAAPTSLAKAQLDLWADQARLDAAIARALRRGSGRAPPLDTPAAEALLLHVTGDRTGMYQIPGADTISPVSVPLRSTIRLWMTCVLR